MWCPTCQIKLSLSAVGPWGLVCAHCQTELDATSSIVAADATLPQTEATLFSSSRAQPDETPGGNKHLRRDPAHSRMSLRPHSALETIGVAETLAPVSSHSLDDHPPAMTGQPQGDSMAKSGWLQGLLPPVAAICLFACGQLLHLVAFAQQQRQSLTLATVMSVAAVCIALLYGRRSSEIGSSETATHSYQDSVAQPAAPAAPSWRKRKSIAASTR